jgi:hypothetical protein
MAGTGTRTTQIFLIKSESNFPSGANNHNTCKSLISYQTVVECDCESNYYCTKGTYQTVSGGCGGDSGGPSWTFGRGNIRNIYYINNILISGFTGVTHGITHNEQGCIAGATSVTVFADLKFYRTWIEDNIRGSLARC